MRPESIQAPRGTRRGNRNRQTSVDCHEKARLNLMQAVYMPPGNQRSLLECSAAAWSMRAEQLQRQEARLAARVSSAEAEAEDVRL